MNQKEYFEFAEKFFAACIELSRKKNADYTGGTEDAFSNFTSVEVVHVRTEAGFLTRMMDKIKRIGSFVKQGTLQVKDETVIDTLRDLANYACLFAGYLESQKAKSKYNGEQNTGSSAPGLNQPERTQVNDGDQDFSENSAGRV